MSKQTPTSVQNMNTLNKPEIIYEAVQNGFIEMLNLLFYLDPPLINHRCEINNKTLVETAVYFGQDEVLWYLLQFNDLRVSEEAYAAYTREGYNPFIARKMNERMHREASTDKKRC